MACGTEGGCVSLFINDKTEDINQNDRSNVFLKGKANPIPNIYRISTYLDVPLKLGHSIVQLEWDSHRTPVFKKRVSARPVLALDLGFCDDRVVVFYRTDIQTMSCLVINTNTGG